MDSPSFSLCWEMKVTLCWWTFFGAFCGRSSMITAGELPSWGRVHIAFQSTKFGTLLWNSYLFSVGWHPSIVVPNVLIFTERVSIRVFGKFVIGWQSREKYKFSRVPEKFVFFWCIVFGIQFVFGLWYTLCCRDDCSTCYYCCGIMRKLCNGRGMMEILYVFGMEDGNGVMVLYACRIKK